MFLAYFILIFLDFIGFFILCVTPIKKYQLEDIIYHFLAYLNLSRCGLYQTMLYFEKRKTTHFSIEESRYFYNEFLATFPIRQPTMLYVKELVF